MIEAYIHLSIQLKRMKYMVITLWILSHINGYKGLRHQTNVYDDMKDRPHSNGMSHASLQAVGEIV